MNIEEILSKGESETVEFKESFDRECIEVCLCKYKGRHNFYWHK